MHSLTQIRLFKRKSRHKCDSVAMAKNLEYSPTKNSIPALRIAVFITNRSWNPQIAIERRFFSLTMSNSNENIHGTSTYHWPEFFLLFPLLKARSLWPFIRVIAWTIPTNEPKCCAKSIVDSSLHARWRCNYTANNSSFASTNAYNPNKNRKLRGCKRYWKTSGVWVDKWAGDQYVNRKRTDQFHTFACLCSESQFLLTYLRTNIAACASTKFA